MTFRDDREASRARIEALEEKLAEAKAEAEAAKLDAKDAREEARRARSGEGAARSSPQPTFSSGDGRMVGFIALVVGLPAILLGYSCWSEHRSHGLPIPKASTAEQRVPGCSCKLTDGRTIELGMSVTGAGPLPSPGEPWVMNLAWQAHGAGAPLPLVDPLGYGHTAPPRTAQEQLMYGYVIDVGVACVGDDRLIVASGRQVSTWSIADRRLVHNEEIEPPSKPTMLSGRRMELRCHSLETSGDTVMVPSRKGHVRLPIRAAAKK